MVLSGGPFCNYYTLSQHLLSCLTLLGEITPPLTYEHTHRATCNYKVKRLCTQLCSQLSLSTSVENRALNVLNMLW